MDCVIYPQTPAPPATPPLPAVDLPTDSDHQSTLYVVAESESPSTTSLTSASVPAILSTSDILPSVTMDCDIDPRLPAPPVTYDITLPAMPTDSSDQSVVEYIISLPDAVTDSPVVQCVVDGIVLPNSLQQSPARPIVLPEDIRPYPVAERVHSLAMKRKSKAKSATLITGSPFKANLMGNLVCKHKRQTKSKDAVQQKGGPSSKLPPKAQKVNTKAKNIKSIGRPNSVVKDNDNCGNCGFQYGEPNDPLIEDDWLVCVHCAKWCHFSCGIVLRKKTFACHKCV